MGQKKLIFSSFFLLVASLAHGQWECPSRLGAQLKPIGSSNLMWSTEITSTYGSIKDYQAASVMGFVGLNYTKGNHSLYLEGGAKAWRKSSDKTFTFTEYVNDEFVVTTEKYRNSDVNLGLREAFYKYNTEQHHLTLGLQSAHSDDSYLLNERIVGANYEGKWGRFQLNAIGGSVMQPFSRNGRFCTLGYLYNVSSGRPRDILGRDFGQTNFGMLSVSLLPNKAKAGLDEFSETAASTSDKKTWNLSKLGAVVYTQFGSWFPQTTTLGGLYADVDVADISFKPEILYQNSKGNNALIYSFSADKMLIWNANNTTRFFAKYVGTVAIDKNARAINSFSNLFAGEVLRLDVLEAPFVQIGLKHSFTKWKASLKLQAAMQTKASPLSEQYGYVPDEYNSPLCKMQELDVIMSKNFGSKFLINASFGFLQYPNLTETDMFLHYNKVQTMFGKLECRITL